MAEIILCRHGYTPANADSSNGDVSIRDMIYYDEMCPLEINYGRKQADELGDFLSGEYNNKKIMVCYGPYYRTRETKHHVVEKLKQNNDVKTLCVPAIREINQGLNYANFRDSFDADDYEAQFFYDNIKGKNRVGISYLQGESESEVRQRVRSFANKLKEFEKTSKFDGEEYDLLVAISHSTTIKAIYYDMYKKSLGFKTSTASATKISEYPELIFKPQTQVPENFVVDFRQYEDYFKLRSLYEPVLSLKQDVKFHAFFGSHIPLPLLEDVDFSKGVGETKISLSPTGKNSFHLIESRLGKDSYSLNKKSSSTFWILDGDGSFDIDGKVMKVQAGDIVRVNPNSTYYYNGQMKMVEKCEPKFDMKEVVEVQSVDYSNLIGEDFLP